MAYRYGERDQKELFPQSIDEYIPADDPVRAYDAFIEALDLKKLGITIDSNQVGNSSYDPKAMLKLLNYSYSYGWKSSRKIERAIHHNVSFIWLMGSLQPDHKTIAEFRRNNKEALKKVLKQCTRMCIKLELIDGNILFVDGTKIRANASRSKNYSKKQYKKMLAQIDQKIAKMLDECDRIDNEELDCDSLVKLKKELSNQQTLKQKMQEIVEEFKSDEESSKTINATDSDSKIMKSIQGSHASYNVQSVVDDKHGLIVQAEATDSPTDHRQLLQQIEQAENTTGKECNTVCADAGYSDVDDLAILDAKGKTIIVPNQEQASDKQQEPFSKRNFIYDEKHNQYICPEGHILKYSSYNKERNSYRYCITSKKICKICEHYGVCTNDKKGRSIKRLVNEKVKEKLAREYENQESQIIYARRKMRVEHPFGHIKHNLGIKNFLLRGLAGVQAEVSIATTCFNIARMITLCGGVTSMITKLVSLNS